MDVTILPERRVNVMDHVARNRKADPLAAPRLGQNESVDSYHRPFRVHQWPPAVARIDRRVSLYIDSWIFVRKLTRHRTDNTHADGVVHPQRAAKRQYQLTLFEF